MLNAHGLSCLAQPWWYFSTAEQRWRRVQLIEVRPGSVRARNGPYPQGSETVHITEPDLSSLTLALPDGPSNHRPPDYGRWPDRLASWTAGYP
jgi:hypothetical protein